MLPCTVGYVGELAVLVYVQFSIVSVVGRARNVCVSVGVTFSDLLVFLRLGDELWSWVTCDLEDLRSGRRLKLGLTLFSGGGYFRFICSPLTTVLIGSFLPKAYAETRFGGGFKC